MYLKSWLSYGTVSIKTNQNQSKNQSEPIKINHSLNQSVNRNLYNIPSRLSNQKLYIFFLWYHVGFLKQSIKINQNQSIKSVDQPVIRNLYDVPLELGWNSKISNWVNQWCSIDSHIIVNKTSNHVSIRESRVVFSAGCLYTRGNLSSWRLCWCPSTDIYIRMCIGLA